MMLDARMLARNHPHITRELDTTRYTRVNRGPGPQTLCGIDRLVWKDRSAHPCEPLSRQGEGLGEREALSGRRWDRPAASAAA